MRKDRTDSPLAVLTEAQADELFVILQHMPYGRAVEWASENLGVETSIAGLARWWSRQSRARLRAQIRRDIDASAQFDRIADDSVLDERMRKALKDGFFRCVAADDPEAALDFAKIALKANRGADDKTRLARLLASERERDALQARVAELEAALQAAGKTESAADPAKVAAEVDKLLGRAPK